MDFVLFFLFRVILGMYECIAFYQMRFYQLESNLSSNFKSIKSLNNIRIISIVLGMLSPIVGIRTHDFMLFGLSSVVVSTYCWSLSVMVLSTIGRMQLWQVNQPKWIPVCSPMFSHMKAHSLQHYIVIFLVDWVSLNLFRTNLLTWVIVLKL